MKLATGTRIGPYEIVGWLGAGGMGEVYRARDPRLGREVAIKLIPDTFATDARRLRRFEQEARAAGQLNHPNILAVYDVGVEAGAPFIVSELLEGESLRRRLQRAPAAAQSDRLRAPGRGWPRRRARQRHRPSRRQARQPVHHGRRTHQDSRLRHRQADGPDDEPALRVGLQRRRAGTVVGTAGYMSPEQVRGEAVDARSDIFSLGTILFEMLTGRAAFTRENAADTMAAILKEDSPDPLPPTFRRRSSGSSRAAWRNRARRGFSRRAIWRSPWNCLSGTTDTAAAPRPGIGRACVRRHPGGRSWPARSRRACAGPRAVGSRGGRAAAAPLRLSAQPGADVSLASSALFGHDDHLARRRRPRVCGAEKRATAGRPGSNPALRAATRPAGGRGRCPAPTTRSLRSFPPTDSGSDFSPMAS